MHTDPLTRMFRGAEGSLKGGRLRTSTIVWQSDAVLDAGIVHWMEMGQAPAGMGERPTPSC